MREELKELIDYQPMTREEIEVALIHLGLTKKDVAEKLGIKYPNYISTALAKENPRLSYNGKLSIRYRIEKFIQEELRKRKAESRK